MEEDEISKYTYLSVVGYTLATDKFKEVREKTSIKDPFSDIVCKLELMGNPASDQNSDMIKHLPLLYILKTGAEVASFEKKVFHVRYVHPEMNGNFWPNSLEKVFENLSAYRDVIGFDEEFHNFLRREFEGQMQREFLDPNSENCCIIEDDANTEMQSDSVATEAVSQKDA